MRITFEFDMNYEDHPGDDHIPPKELAAIMLQVETRMNVHGQLRRMTVNLPYWNDDTQDIIDSAMRQSDTEGELTKIQFVQHPRTWDKTGS